MKPVSRRNVLALGTAAGAGVLAGAPALATPRPAVDIGGTADAAHAWRRLRDGNARFAAGAQRHPHQDPAWRESLVDGQEPFAVVLGCADSRVPAELLFDQGLGDLFTIRSAGEVLDDAVLGSVEYAVAHLAVPLVVVLGHTGCGAVTAAIELVRGDGHPTGAVNTLVRAIEATVRSTEPDPDERAFLAACVRNQASRVRAELTERSTAIRRAVRSGRLTIVDAVYDLETGLVGR